jgi:hypothetical protein
VFGAELAQRKVTEVRVEVELDVLLVATRGARSHLLAGGAGTIALALLGQAEVQPLPHGGVNVCRIVRRAQMLTQILKRGLGRNLRRESALAPQRPAADPDLVVPAAVERPSW